MSIAVAVTLQPAGFEPEGIDKNRADYLFREVGALVNPQNAPPKLPG